MGAPPRHLPAQPTPLIGRERELLELCDRLLRPEVRLLTLTGAGGSGKTRLALEVAALQQDAFEDGVVFVDLTDIRDPALVVSAISRALGLWDAGGPPLFDRLRQSLRDRCLLLLLDNFEQVLPAAARVAELLTACPALKVLVTSRAALRLRWEQAFPLLPLALPDPTHLADPQAVAQAPAVALFVQRAQAAHPGFRLTPETAGTVAAICVRLDGLPLAIELAAARVRVLPPPALLARLGNRLALLTAGAADEPARHQTLRAALAWSYDLLTAPEQTLFRRLAVFGGSFALSAVQEVCADDGLAAQEILDLLARLVDQSLVVAEAEPGGKARFRLLETVREYALEQLGASREREPMGHRHAAVFLALVERAAPALHTPQQVAWLERLGLEHDNLRAALRWAIERADAGLGLRLAGALWEFWWWRGYLSEGLHWLEAVLALSGSADPALAAARARALHGAGVLTSLRGEHERAAALVHAGVALWRELGDKTGLGRSLNDLALLAFIQRNPVRAQALLEQSEALLREAADTWGLGYARFCWGTVKRLQGNVPEAASSLEASAATFRDLGDKRGMAYALVSLGGVILDLKDVERAAALNREGLHLFGELGDTWGILWSLVNLGRAAAMRGDHDRAARLLGAAEAVSKAIGSPLHPDMRADHMRADHAWGVAAARAGLGEEAFSVARAAGQAMSVEQAVMYALTREEPARAAAVGRRGPLTAREREIAELLARGLSNKEIAQALVITERTAETHVTHILTKLDLASRVQVGPWAAAHSLLPPEPS